MRIWLGAHSSGLSPILRSFLLISATVVCLAAIGFLSLAKKSVEKKIASSKKEAMYFYF